MRSARGEQELGYAVDVEAFGADPVDRFDDLGAQDLVGFARGGDSAPVEEHEGVAVADIVSLGFAAHRFGDRAAEHAVAEALIQHASARDLDLPDSLIRNAEALGNGAVAGLAPHDPDRRYRDAFGPDFRGLIDPMCHVQLGLDPRVAALVRERTNPEESTAPGETEGEPVRSRLEDAGHRVAVVDATAERVRRAGYAAARVIVPGLARLQPAAFPLAPDAGLARAATALGWSTEGPDEPVPYPGW